MHQTQIIINELIYSDPKCASIKCQTKAFIASTESVLYS